MAQMSGLRGGHRAGCAMAALQNDYGSGKLHRCTPHFLDEPHVRIFYGNYFANPERLMKRYLFFIVLILPFLTAGTPFTATAQEKRPFTATDLWSLTRLSSPALSPDGRTVAVVATTTDIKTNKSNGDTCGGRRSPPVHDRQIHGKQPRLESGRHAACLRRQARR